MNAREARDGLPATAEQGGAAAGAAPVISGNQEPAQMNNENPLTPHSYPRRILLAVTGLSPQIVTETLYALSVKQEPSFVPTEIHVITTAEGADRARLALLHEKSGWFHRLCRDYSLESIDFDTTNLHILNNGQGDPLNDIRTLADNERAADTITEIVRRLTEDTHSSLHVSIAGGRKTMGFYVGYALSLYGRPQDRLSHVLVNPPYESHPEFYYPTPDSHVIYTAGPDSRPLDTHNAEVTLAEIPFVRLRHGLPDALLTGRSRFSESVTAVQRNVGPRELTIDIGKRCIRAGNVILKLAPVDLAFYSWFARLLLDGNDRPACPNDGVPEAGHAHAFMEEYRRIMREMDDTERTVKRLEKGMDKQFFLEHKSELHKKLKTALRQEASYYMIEGKGRPMRYALTLPATAIRYGAIEDD
jgi:CRISPR-associated protein (TIGR02584 family)